MARQYIPKDSRIRNFVEIVLSYYDHFERLETELLRDGKISKEKFDRSRSNAKEVLIRKIKAFDLYDETLSLEENITVVKEKYDKIKQRARRKFLRGLENGPIAFEGDIIITDPCYIRREDDDDREIENYGLTKFIACDTVYGDWACTTFEKDTKEVLGRFCADGGMVGIFLLREVLQYNPDFDYHIARPWTTTLIKNFNGKVWTHYDKKKDSLQVFGEGNINFFTSQTGF